ncbi:MAG: hypothetical protein PHZ19_10505, partial [Candidatus Thermoplasmatota archaeon]|nr:hypothetical protein [Candidatus Thermoplasmatota archaeon]
MASPERGDGHGEDQRIQVWEIVQKWLVDNGYDVLSRPLAWDPVAFTVPKPREERKVTSHYASSLVGCVREAYYRWIGAPITDPTSRISRMKMEAGEDAAQWFGRGLVRRAPEWGYEAKILDAEVVIEIFPPGLLNPIHGRLDYLVEIS